ncbi:thiaminase II [Caenispirillum salinarum]|uniref:thiaminase II n=1 Tax=Caenispirillum salinarum TaxID=859058 RepID=UPI00384DD17D
MSADIYPHLKASCADSWEAYVHHAFCRQLAAGTLPEDCFRHYLTQDYLFLIHFSRAWALAVSKAEHLDEMRHAVTVTDALLNHEMALHVKYCAEWGLTEDQMAEVAEDPANIAYTRYVLDRGHSGDLLDLLVALAPCVIGYAEIGAWMVKHADTKIEGNPYRAWIEMYSDAEYQEVAAGARGLIEKVAERRIGAEPIGSGRWNTLRQTFETATRLEIGFWDMGLAPARG